MKKAIITIFAFFLFINYNISACTIVSCSLKGKVFAAANEDDYFWTEDEFDDGEDSLDDNGDSCFCEMQECSKDGGCPECGETDDEKLDLVHGDHGYRCMTCDATFTCP